MTDEHIRKDIRIIWHAYKPEEDKSNNVYQKSTKKSINLASKH